MAIVTLPFPSVLVCREVLLTLTTDSVAEPKLRKFQHFLRFATNVLVWGALSATVRYFGEGDAFGASEILVHVDDVSETSIFNARPLTSVKSLTSALLGEGDCADASSSSPTPIKSSIDANANLRNFPGPLSVMAKSYHTRPGDNKRTHGPGRG